MTNTHPTAGPTPDLDAVVTRLAAGERGWAATPLAQRRELLLEVGTATSTHAREWVRTATAIKQLDDASPLVGEEWLSGPYAVIGYVQALQETLRRLAEGGDVLAGYPVDRAPGGRLAVRVLPHQAFDRLLLNGFRAEVWTRPGVTEEQLRAGAGLGQRTPEDTRGVRVLDRVLRARPRGGRAARHRARVPRRRRRGGQRPVARHARGQRRRASKDAP